MSTTIVKKLSAKKIVGTVKSKTFKINESGKRELIDDGTSVHLYTVLGMATGYEIGESDHGEFVKFTGNFEAITSDGDTFISDIAFLQNPIPSMLRATIDSTGGPVEFAFDVAIVVDSASEVGYEYRVTSRLEHKPINVIENLRAKLLPCNEELKLEAPKKPAKKAE